MSKRIFTEEQVEELQGNPHVSKCSKKSITFSKDFKLKAVKLNNEQGITPQDIFKMAGIVLSLIGRKIPKECLKRWNKAYKTKGEAGLLEARGKNGKGGGRSKTRFQTDKEKIKYLEAQVAYLKAENDFLAKLRAKRAE